jgi:hypothetical protein
MAQVTWLRCTVPVLQWLRECCLKAGSVLGIPLIPRSGDYLQQRSDAAAPSRPDRQIGSMSGLETLIRSAMANFRFGDCARSTGRVAAQLEGRQNMLIGSSVLDAE